MTEIQKIYYTIPKIAKQLGIAPSHVRHYMKEFQIEGNGDYGRLKRVSLDDVVTLRRIHHEVTVEGRHYWRVKQILNLK